ncbi:DUF1028 domain-containing protein [Aestuariivirga sp.]|uniref:DUF1028 domain-containing protein n=1 Tax=Aestuariivirga sp. TaxID=2650926 RepID=UPI0039E25921
MPVAAQIGCFGVAVATSSIAVGARCPYARAVPSPRGFTDPNLGPMLLDLMEQGLSAREYGTAASERQLGGRGGPQRQLSWVRESTS